MPADRAMRVVSGIQPTGELHLGNLLGAILRWVRMQDEAECLFFLADLHALTVDGDPAQLRANVREMAAALIASGIDPDQVDPVRPERGPRPCRARLDPAVHRAHGLAQPHDPVQGQVGQEPRRRQRRPVHLSGAPGRRRAALPGDPRPGRRGPEAAYRAGPRHRAQVQHRLSTSSCSPRPSRSSAAAPRRGS